MIDIRKMKKIISCLIAILFSVEFPSYAAPGFMDAQAGLSSIVNGIVVVEWILILIALLFFRYHRKSASKKIRWARWLLVVISAFTAILTAIAWIKSSENEIARLFYSSIILVGAVALGTPAIILALVHWVTRLIQKRHPHRDAWAYNFVLFLWIVTPATSIGSAYIRENSISRQTAVTRNEIKPLIAECCSGKAEFCLKASERFDFLTKLNQYRTSQFYEMERKYMAQACQKGNKDSCEQFYYHTGEEKYQEHWLYKQPCDPRDADIPFYKPESDCC